MREHQICPQVAALERREQTHVEIRLWQDSERSTRTDPGYPPGTGGSGLAVRLRRGRCLDRNDARGDGGSRVRGRCRWERRQGGADLADALGGGEIRRPREELGIDGERHDRRGGVGELVAGRWLELPRPRRVGVAQAQAHLEALGPDDDGGRHLERRREQGGDRGHHQALDPRFHFG
ncbi:MAG: hypothetical protein JW751_06500 [Polyangiaceae bacterium]|nr:hypothetical protein [Polyangiaceae bacterium]